MEILNADKLNSMIKMLNLKSPDAETIEDPTLRQFAEYVYVIAQVEAKALQGTDSLSPENLFYSRYYWFTRLKERYTTLYGRDEGLEQQSFMMLSQYDVRFPNEIDWNIIEQIENNPSNL